MKIWLVFVVGAILCWGCYVPTLHEGQTKLGGKPSLGALRAFICVGVAYFITAVLVPGGLLYSTNMEARSFNMSGSSISIVAGVLGAAGALCIILAIKVGGKPLLIAPLVFAGAPIVNTLVTMLIHPPDKAPSPLFFIGILLAAAGAFIAMYNKPPSAKPTPVPAVTASADQPASDAKP